MSRRGKTEQTVAGITVSTPILRFNEEILTAQQRVLIRCTRLHTRKTEQDPWVVPTHIHYPGHHRIQESSMTKSRKSNSRRSASLKEKTVGSNQASTITNQSTHYNIDIISLVGSPAPSQSNSLPSSQVASKSIKLSIPPKVRIQGYCIS